MCDPVSASIALTVAGTTAQAAAANKAKKAMAGAANAERIRQRGYNQSSEAALEESKSFSEKSLQDKRMEESVADRQAAYAADAEAARAPVAAVGQNIAGDQSGNAVVQAESSRRTGDAIGAALQRGNAMANMQGFNDLQLGNALYNNRISQRQNLLGSFMKGSADVLPFEMQAASQKGQNLATLGQLLNTAGMITGIGAGAGWWGGAEPAAAGLQGATVTNVAVPQSFASQLSAAPGQITSSNLQLLNSGNPLNFQLGLQPAKAGIQFVNPAYAAAPAVNYPIR